jgi:hypothetical protein
MMKSSELLREAATVMDQRGLTQVGQYQDDETGEVCSVGALKVALGGQANEMLPRLVARTYLSARKVLLGVMRDELNEGNHVLPSGENASITALNDYRLKDKFEAITMMEKAAIKLEELGQ